MWTNIGSWYTNVNTSNYITPLWVRKSVKNSKDWQRSVLDDFERIGVDQLSDNYHYLDYYRMIDGDLSHRELSEVIPELDNVQDLLDGVGIPTFLKHYDLIGIIINVLVGNYMEMQDLFHVTDTGEIANNDYLRKKDEMFRSFLKEKIDAEIELHLMNMGLDPKKSDFQTEEERQAYMQQLQQVVNEKTPKHIEAHLQKSFKTVGIKWGEATLEQDRERFQMDKLERGEFKDFLATGRCFRHYRIGYDHYQPEKWSPINTFFSQTVDSEYAQDGEFVGRVHYLTPSETIQRLGHYIKTTDQKKLLGGKPEWKSYIGYAEGSLTNAIEQNFHKQVVAPHANYFDYNYALNLQDYLGTPMGQYKDLKTGEEYDRFLSRRHGDSYKGNYSYINALRTDLNINMDMCQVTEVYFIAYDMVGYLSYTDEATGEIFNEIVTEDILSDFLKDKDIKQIKTHRLVDVKDDFEENTLQWFYRPVCYEGVKVSSFNLEEPLYVYCKPCDHQIRGESNFFDVKLPVAGKIGKSLAKKIAPYQTKFNLCMNQIYSLLEKEIGTFFLMDVAFIPSEYKEWGDTEEALMHLRNIAKDVGVMPLATSGDTQSNNTIFNQFSTQSITFSGQIANRQQLAEYYKQKAFEVIGITQQQLGASNKYTTDEGVKVSQNASYAQTAQIYAEFSEYNQRALDLHLSIAQYAQGEGKDITVAYTKSDSSLAFLQMEDEHFPFRKLGIIASNDNKKRKDLESLKQSLLNNNTLGSDALELAELIKSDAYSELVELARINRTRKEEEAQEKHQRDQQLLTQQQQGASQLESEKDEREEISKQRDRDTKIEVARLVALGRATDREAGTAEFDQINEEADRAIKGRAIDSKERVEMSKMKNEDKRMTADFKTKMEELKLKAKELNQRERERQTKEFTSIINKN